MPPGRARRQGPSPPSTSSASSEPPEGPWRRRCTRRRSHYMKRRAGARRSRGADRATIRDRPTRGVPFARLRARRKYSLSWGMRFRGLIRVGATCALVFAQLAAVASGPGCPCGSSDMASMPDMPAGGTHHMPAPGDMSHHAPCSQSMAPGECAAMAACATVAAMALPAATPVAPAPAPGVFAATASAPRSVSRAPEPPPPRA